MEKTLLPAQGDKMSIGTYVRGNKIISKDNKNLAEKVKECTLPCIRCGRPPTKEGFDACIGHIEGAYSACCGHGVHEPFIIMEEK